jgi:hypothetical protein
MAQHRARSALDSQIATRFARVLAISLCAMRIAFSLLLVTGLAAADGGLEPSMVPFSELNLGGIKVGQTGESITRALGEPKRRIETDEGLQFDYPGLTLYLGVGEYGVWGMESTDKGICTPSKVCPGMTLSAVKTIYGEPLVAERPHGKFFEYYSKDATCWLQLVVKKGAVRAVRVECQP